MGAVKDGYGPKDPTPLRGAAPAALPSKMDKGLSPGIKPSSVGQRASAALAAGKALRAKQAAGTATHAESTAYNIAMAELQQHDSLTHASVLAINHLENLIASGQANPKHHDQLAQAKQNLRARLRNIGA